MVWWSVKCFFPCIPISWVYTNRENWTTSVNTRVQSREWSKELLHKITLWNSESSTHYIYTWIKTWTKAIKKIVAKVMNRTICVLNSCVYQFYDCQVQQSNAVVFTCSSQQWLSAAVWRSAERWAVCHGPHKASQKKNSSVSPLLTVRIRMNST